MKFLIVAVFFLIQLSAEDIAYRFHLSQDEVYLNEAVVLEVNLSQENHDNVMHFNFTLKKSEAYSFHQINFKESDDYHNLKQQYRFLIYPKKIGECAIEFNMIKSLTNDDKVAYAISGDRDNVKNLVKKDIKIELKPLLLNVKSLPPGTDLVGDFTLDYKLDKTSTKAYAPVHLNLRLKGWGEVPDDLVFVKESEKYHLFSQEPQVQHIHSETGTHSRIEWSYAISAKESFVLPKVVLKAFNPDTHKQYDLVLPQQEISIHQVTVENLVDKEDTPLPTKGFDWSWLGWVFSYVMVFLAGVLMPRDFFKSKKVFKEKTFEEKVTAVQTHKELLKLLLSTDTVQYKEAILSLERVMYNKEKISLSKIKNMVL